MSQYCVYAIKPYNHSQSVVWHASPAGKPLRRSVSLERILPPGPMVFEADNAKMAISEYQGHLNVEGSLDVRQSLKGQREIILNSIPIEIDVASKPVKLRVSIPKARQKAIVWGKPLEHEKPKRKRRRLKKKRILWGKEKGEYGKRWHESFKGNRCPNCGREWGKLHNSDGYYICDVEQCPYCKEQLSFCKHAVKIFKNLKEVV